MNRWGVGKPPDEHRCTYTKRGKRCGKWRKRGQKVCWKHGAGSDKRVREGKRKPAGRPITTGTDADPNLAKNRSGVLGEYIEKYKDDATIMNPRRQVAIATAALDAVVSQYLKNPDAWDVLKTINQFGKIKEHPESWIIKQSERVQNILAKALAAAFADKITAAITVLQPAVKHIHEMIDKFVPEPLREECRKWIGAKLAGITFETQ